MSWNSEIINQFQKTSKAQTDLVAPWCDSQKELAEEKKLRGHPLARGFQRKELWYSPSILVLKFICYALLSTPPRTSILYFPHIKNNGYHLSAGPLIRLNLFFEKNFRFFGIRCCIGENCYYSTLAVTPRQPRESNSKALPLNTKKKL